jgi:hypothetical protein
LSYLGYGLHTSQQLASLLSPIPLD